MASLNFIFDLDGTLVDSVYLHTLAWHEALEAMGMELASWRIHRHIGMSDDLIAQEVAHETHRELSEAEIETLRRLHSEAYLKRAEQLRVLPGARQVLQTLTKAQVPWAIATSSNRERAKTSLELLGVGADAKVVTRDPGIRGKPNPDLFLKAADLLKVKAEDCLVVGDSVWDLLAARRARMLGVGVLCGGNPQEELVRAGAYRVYQDPADLLRHMDELGLG
jgi:HAD superfamily hydrolase (TIGR01509 family)